MMPFWLKGKQLSLFPTLSGPLLLATMPAGKAPHPKLTGQLFRLLDECKVGGDFKLWCEVNGVHDVLDLALLADTAALVDTKILDRCKGDVKGADTDIKIMAPIRRAHYLARDSLGSGRAIKDKDLNNEVLGEERAAALDTEWEVIHGVVLSPQFRVGETLLLKLYKISVSSPGIFPIIPLDKITIEAETAQTLKVDKDSTDAVLYTRDVKMIGRKMKALLFSFAFVNIKSQTWFSLQHAQDADIWINLKLDDADPSPECLKFFKVAYIETMRLWQNSIVVYKTTLSEAVRDRSWLSLWTWRSPPRSGDGNSYSKKSLENTIFKTMQRAQRSAQGGKGSWGSPKGSKGGGKGDKGGKGGQGGGQRPYNAFVQKNSKGDKGAKKGGGKSKGGKKGGW